MRKEGLLAAFRKGIPMGKKVAWEDSRTVVFLVGLATLVGAPWGLSLVDNRVGRALLFLLFTTVVSLCFMLIPYWGQKKITEEHDQANESYIASCEKSLNEWRNKANKLEGEVAELKQKTQS